MQMRGFLGITVHSINMESSELQSFLLCCDRFTGSHTGERISEAFESVCHRYGIRQKIDYIICDNAANMRKAFSVCFLRHDEDDTSSAGVN